MLVPVKLSKTQIAPSRHYPDNPDKVGLGMCATCSLCDHTAAVKQEADETQAFAGREAIRLLSRTCPRGEIHSYYHDRLPAGVLLHWEHRGQLLPAYLIGRELVTCAGPLSHNVPVVVGYEAKEQRLAAEDLADRLRLKGGYRNVSVAKKPGRPAQLKVAGGAE